MRNEKGFENLANVKKYDAKRIAKLSDSELDELYFATNDETVLKRIDTETDKRRNAFKAETNYRTGNEYNTIGF